MNKKKYLKCKLKYLNLKGGSTSSVENEEEYQNDNDNNDNRGNSGYTSDDPLETSDVYWGTLDSNYVGQSTTNGNNINNIGSNQGDTGSVRTEDGAVTTLEMLGTAGFIAFIYAMMSSR